MGLLSVPFPKLVHKISVGKFQEDDMDSPSGQRMLESIKPLNRLSHFLGIMTFRNPKIRQQKWFKVYRGVIFSILIVSAVHEIPTMKFWVTNVSSLHSILALVEILLRWSVLFVNLIMDWFNNHAMNVALDNLLSQSIILSSSTLRTLTRMQVFHIILNGTLCTVFQTIGNIFVWENDNYKLYTVLIYVGTEFYLGFTNIIFVQMVLLLKEHFKELNSQLNKISTTSKITTTQHFFLVYNKEGKEVAQEVIHIRKTHLTLCNITQAFNNCFSTQMLLATATNIVEITYSLRSLVFYIGRSSDQGWWSSKPWLEFLLTFFWYGYYMGSLVQLVSACDLTVVESQRSSQIAHELINKGVGEAWEKELVIFSQQLNHHSAHFTAGKLFALRFSLIRSVIGAIITYLVIIVTFKE